MREYLKKAVFLASAGFIIGILVGLGILALTGIQAYQEEYGSGGLTLYILSSGFLGALNTGAAVVYSVERWGLLKTTLMHFCVCMGSLCAVGFSVGWLSPGDAATWITLAACVAAYFVIWVIMYLRGRREVRELNDALARWKHRQRDED